MRSKFKDVNEGEILCLSCDKIIKEHNLARHDKAKSHLKMVEKKVSAMKQNI
jgi:hypothetical protein